MYGTSIEQCDVLSLENLKAFREHREKWLNWLDGDDPNAVWNQIVAMEWNHRVFLMINESRKIASKQGSPAATLNPLLAEFIDQGYVAFQALAIRKQLEQSNKNTKKQVTSLRRTLDDIRKNQSIITRECYVCYDGLPFDYEPLKQSHIEHLIEKKHEQLDVPSDAAGAVGELPATGSCAWRSSKRRHETFDQLAKVEKNERSRTDNISSSILDFLIEFIDGDKAPFKNVIEFSNKYVAHAADPISIETLSPDQHGISIYKVEECQKRLWQVAQYAISTILYHTYIVPGIAYQGNPLKDLDQPWLHAEKIYSLRQFWDASDMSRDMWPKEFRQCMGS